MAVIDATNATTAARHEIRRVAGRHGVPVVAIVLDLPETIVRTRNAARAERPVPDEVVTRHLAAVARILDSGQLEAEGYARIVRLRTAPEVDRLVIRLEP